MSHAEEAETGMPLGAAPEVLGDTTDQARAPAAIAVPPARVPEVEDSVEVVVVAAVDGADERRRSRKKIIGART